MALTEITIKLPTDMADTISAKEIFNMVMDKALTMGEYYRSRCKDFEQKYGRDFASFKTKVESADKENPSEWDDLLIWEGFELAHREWDKKIEGLRKCTA